jgi:hypothetical protein
MPNAAMMRKPGEKAMRFHGLSSALIILSALAVPGSTSTAQVPAAPTAFDGKYAGGATLTRGVACAAVKSLNMTITGGQVIIHEIHLDEAGLTYKGSVNGAGELSASHESKIGRGRVSTVSGTIHNNVFTGQRLMGGGRNAGCSYSFQMEKR